MRRIAITGSSGYIGSRLVAALLERPHVESVLGLDVCEPTTAATTPAAISSVSCGVGDPKTAPAEAYGPSSHAARFRFHKTDVRFPYADAVVREGVDAAVHLAFAFAPSRRRRWARAVNLDGTRHFLEACLAAKVSRAVVLGSATAYGALPGNPERLAEASPLRAGPSFQYSYEKRLCDEMCTRFAAEHPRVSLAICRPPIVLGPCVDNYFSRMLFKPKVVHVRGEDPEMQFVHEDDICGAILALLGADEPGPFNVAPEGTLRFTELAAEFKRAPLALPANLLCTLCRLTYSARLTWLNETPPGALSYIRYPWLIDGRRLRESTGFTFSHSTLDTVRAWRRSVLERVAAGTPPPGRIRV
ncbi:MAG: NAD-dependent epimerase/dehydratase family protein [Phycisphaerae bacterium]|nr:NAD-dependent epimerase/dehydratase family protein [Phycisphaerae bacterium]